MSKQIKLIVAPQKFGPRKTSSNETRGRGENTTFDNFMMNQKNQTSELKNFFIFSPHYGQRKKWKRKIKRENELTSSHFTNFSPSSKALGTSMGFNLTTCTPGLAPAMRRHFTHDLLLIGQKILRSTSVLNAWFPQYSHIFFKVSPRTKNFSVEGAKIQFLSFLKSFARRSHHGCQDTDVNHAESTKR